jgi:hypothetical protein
MGAKKPEDQNIVEMRAEQARLKHENEHLRSQLSAAAAPGLEPHSPFGWRGVLSIVLLATAAALLVAGNVLFWAGNTLVKNDRFAAAVTPIIQNSQVQKALADYTVQQLYQNVDVEKTVSDALPPRADFIAPTIASQLRSTTQATLAKILARPQFQARASEAITRAHDRYIATVKTHGSDGVLNVHELYDQISGSLQDTKLSFLAGRKLPAKVGNIQVASGPQIGVVSNIANHIDLWRTLAILLCLACAVGGIFLARRRRRAVVRLGILTAVFMFVTLLAIRVAREMLSGRVDAAYSEAIRQAYQIFARQLVMQTATLLLLALVVALVAWVSGPGRRAVAVRSRIADLLGGRAHAAMFGAHENSFTRWVGVHKRLIQWLVVAAVAVADLMIRLTPTVLGISLAVVIVLVLAIEMLAAKPLIPAAVHPVP